MTNDDASIPKPDSATTPRKFRISDAMILVVAAAVGAYGFRVSALAVREYHLSVPSWISIVSCPALAAPSRRELFKQPGFVAGCVALGLINQQFLEALYIKWSRNGDWFLGLDWIGAVEVVSIGIPIAWISLGLAGSLRAERGWIDRVGRILGVIWMIAGVSISFLDLIGIDMFPIESF